MNLMSEHVPLPDHNTRPQLHPLDVADARSSFTRAWVLSLIGSPQALVFVGGIAWFLTDGWVAPVLAVLSTGVIAELARRHLLSEAWAHIPRRRQDLGRSVPMPYSGIEALLLPLVLTAGIVAILVGLGSYGAEVRSWGAGSAATCGLAMVAQAGWTWARRHTAEAGVELVSSLLAVPAGVVVAAATDALGGTVDVTAAASGGALVIGVWALTALIGREWSPDRGMSRRD